MDQYDGVKGDCVPFVGVEGATPLPTRRVQGAQHPDRGVGDCVLIQHAVDSVGPIGKPSGPKGIHMDQYDGVKGDCVPLVGVEGATPPPKVMLLLCNKT